MSIGTLANAARQSLSRGLEALQVIDGPPELFDVAQPVALVMGMLSDLDVVPVARRAERAQAALEVLRESLSSLQRPGLLVHPATERSLAAVAESLGTVVELVRELGDDEVGTARSVRGSEP
jgi:hypothetical protein